MSKFAYLLLGFLVYLSLGGCEWKIITRDDVIVAKQGDYELTNQELEIGLGKNFYNSEDSATKAYAYIEDWKRRIILYQAGLKEGIDKDPETQYIINKATQQIIAERYIDKKVIQNELLNKPIDSADVLQSYNESKSMFVITKESYKIRRFFVQTPEQAMLLKKKAKSLRSLDSMLASLSISDFLRQKNQAESENANSLVKKGEFLFDTPSQEIEVTTMPVNTITEPVKMIDSSYTMLYLVDRKKTGDIMSFKDMYAQVEAKIRAEIRQKIYKQIITEGAKN